jgi:hypothetical protein
MEGETTSGQTIDVSALIEDRPVGAFQWRTLFVCVSVLFMDGYDTQSATSHLRWCRPGTWTGLR